MDFSKLLNLKYLFSIEPAPLHPLQRNILLVLLVMLTLGAVAAIILRRLKKRNIITSRILLRLFNFCLTFSLTGWFLYFCRNQGVYALSRRFWFFLWLFSALFWFFLILKYVIVKAQKERSRLEKKEAFLKYLPKKKGK